MKKIIFHVGLHKTGTTALQSFFTTNRKQLLSMGILYPESGHYINGHHLLSWIQRPEIQKNQMLEKYLTGFSLDTYMKLLLDEVKKSSCQTILISSETFVEKPFEELKNVMRYFEQDEFEYEYHAVIYLRAQNSLFSSYYFQYVKQSIYSKSHKEFDVYNNRLDYYELIKKLSELIEKKSIVVRPYEKAQFYKNNIFDDFMKNIFETEKENILTIPEKDLNPRLSIDELEYKRFLNEIMNQSDDNILRLLFDYSRENEPNSEKAFQDYNLLSLQETKEMEETYRNSNKQVAIEYLKKENGKLFEETIDNSSEHYNAYNGLTIEKTLEISRFLLKEKLNKDVEKDIKRYIVAMTADRMTNQKRLNTDIKFKDEGGENLSLTTMTFIKNKDVESMDLKEDGFHIKSVGPDPHFEISNLERMNSNVIKIQLALTSEVETELEVFYRAGKDTFSREQRLVYEIINGKNNIVDMIIEDEMITALRIDPGKSEGTYILHNLEVTC